MVRRVIIRYCSKAGWNPATASRLIGGNDEMENVPSSWFGFPGKLLQYLIDNVMEIVGKNPDKSE